MKYFLYTRHYSKLEGKSNTSYRLHVWGVGPWDLGKPDLGEFLVTPSHQVLTCLPLWRRWVHNLFLSLLRWQVQTPSWIAPPTPRGESQVENLGCDSLLWAKLEPAARGKQPAGTPAEITQIRNINRQWTLQSVLLSLWKCFVLIFRVIYGCYIPEMQILLLALNKCIRVVFMFRLNRAVSLPGLPCLCGWGWELCDSPHFHVSVRSGHRHCFVITAV